MAVVGFGTTAAVALLSVPMLGSIGAPLSLTFGILVYAGAIVSRLWLFHGLSFSREVVLRVIWTLLVIIPGGIIFHGGDELSNRGIAARVAFASLYLVATWLVFWRGTLRGTDNKSTI